ncbi:cyclin-dependent kinase d-2 [Anaeramoeba ignava]|uniref:[RNA-polymerase]-subunit kinase n=1 Tax=Anaeramoeba ignava TaxID=1746090 RepID=A0A9Q0LEF3_ANAIG|nr:cyclin-dependent kinase d-2 [Anaeramoeba ignava]
MNLRYKKLEVIGQGAFGVVHKAKDTETNEIVALKKIRIGNAEDGVNISAIREIKFLKELNHPNVVKLLNVFHHSQNINIVYEHCKKDLEKVIKDREIMFSPSDIKSLMQMLLEGLNHCHQNWIIHRDMKPSNLLINSKGILKLADFGLSRNYASPSHINTNYQYTNQVVTLWYRAPELLLGCKKYGFGVDIWAAGCIFAELLRRQAIIFGDTEIEVLSSIFEIFGTPNQTNWPGFSSLPLTNILTFQENQPIALTDLFPAASNDLLDLFSKMMKFNPSERISAQKALEHPYFKNEPKPTLPELLPFFKN